MYVLILCFTEEVGLDGIWIYNNPEQSGGGECQALRSGFSKGGVPSEPVVIGCDNPLPFMCRKPARFEGKVSRTCEKQSMACFSCSIWLIRPCVNH